MLDVRHDDSLLYSLAELAATQYGLTWGSARNLMVSGHALVVLDGVDELTDRAKLEVCAGLDGLRSTVPNLKILIGLRNSAMGLLRHPAQWSTIELALIDRRSVLRHGKRLGQLAGLSRAELETLSTQLRTPLALNIASQLSLAQLRRLAAAEGDDLERALWSEYLDRQLRHLPPRESTNARQVMSWFGNLVKRDELVPGSIVQLELLQPEWALDHTAALRARRLLGLLLVPIGLPCIFAFLWLVGGASPLAAAVSAAIVGAASIAFYWPAPAGVVGRNRKVAGAAVQMRAWSAQKAQQQLPRLPRRLAYDAFVGAAAGVAFASLSFIVSPSEIWSTWWGLPLMTACTTFAYVRPGGVRGIMLGTFLVASGLGLMERPLEALAICFIYGLASGLVLGIADLGEEVRPPVPGKDTTYGVFRSSFKTNLVYEAVQWFALVVLFGFLAVGFFELDWAIFALGFWLIATLIWGAAASLIPILQLASSSFAIRRRLHLTSPLLDVLQLLARERLLARVGTGDAFRLFHVSMPVEVLSSVSPPLARSTPSMPRSRARGTRSSER